MTDWFYKFLRKNQKYTGTDNVYLAKGGFWLTAGQLISFAASFFMAIAFANLLDPITYGHYKYILSLVGMLGIFSLIGIREAVTQAVARGLEGSFYTGFKVRLKWGALGSLAAVIAAGYYWHQGNEILPIPLLLIAVFLPLLYASQIYTSFLGGRKLFDVRVKYGVAGQIISFAALIGTLLLTKNLLWLIIVYLASNTFLNYFFYLLVKFKFRPNKEEDKKTINYGKHLSLMDVVSAAGSYLDKILLFGFVGSAQLAVYSFATIIPEQINTVLQNVNILALPKLAEKSRAEIKATIMKKILKIALLVGVIIAAYIVFSPYFYKIFFPKYLNSIPYSQLFIFNLVALPTSLLGTVFRAKMMKKELYFLKITIASTRIALFFVLIPLYGIWGLIFASVGADALNSILALFLFKTRFKS